MKNNHLTIKIMAVAGSILFLSVLHYAAPHGQITLHILHRELYFIPILLAAFWFGVRGGASAAVAVGIIYAPHVVSFGDPHMETATVIMQLAMFGVIGIFMGYMVDRKNRQHAEMLMISDTFGRYVPAGIRDQVLQGRVPLDGAIVEVAVLSAGIRHFDLLLGSLPPALIVRIMNTYFEYMASVIRQKNGLVLRIVDGCILAVFGAPIHDQQRCRNALDVALSMRKAMNTVNAHFRENRLPEQEQQIGIHSGMAVAANIGSPDRLTYSVIGKTVARASLIRNYCEVSGKDILASNAAVKEHAREFGAYKIADAVSFFGTPEPLFTLTESVETKN